MNGITCECGNSDPARFIVKTEIIGFKIKYCGTLKDRRPVHKFVGYTCLICLKLIKLKELGGYD